MAPEIDPKSFGTFEKQAPGDIQELQLKAASSRNDMEASCILTNPDNPAMSLITIGDIDNPCTNK